MSRYYIEKECLKCPACKHTGWKEIDTTTDRKRAKSLSKYWRHYFGNEIKIRMRSEQGGKSGKR